MKKICTFEHLGGDVIVSDPGVDEIGGISNLVFGIYPGDAGRRLRVYLPADSYDVYLNERDVVFRIIRKNVEGTLLKDGSEPVSTSFSRNICCVSSSAWGSSEYLPLLPLRAVQFNARDMLQLIRKRGFQVSSKCKMVLDDSLVNSTYPDATVLDESLLFNLRDIPNTSWNTYVMLMTHESLDYFFKLTNGVSISVPATGYCNVTYLFDVNGICGLDIVPDYKCE